MVGTTTATSSTRRPTSVFAERPFAYSEAVRERLGATGEEMASYIGVSFRTYQRRAQQGNLADAESAKVEMLSALLDLGAQVFRSDGRTREWLTSPILSLGGERPIDLLETVKGYERVKSKLMQIEYGTY